MEIQDRERVDVRLKNIREKETGWALREVRAAKDQLGSAETGWKDRRTSLIRFDTRMKPIDPERFMGLGWRVLLVTRRFAGVNKGSFEMEERSVEMLSSAVGSGANVFFLDLSGPWILDIEKWKSIG